MATERLVLRIDEKGATVVSRNLEKLGRNAQQAGGGVKLLRAALGALGTISVVATMRQAIATMASFSQEMSTVRAISGAVGDTFDELREKARELGASTRFSATQAAQGMTFLARAGFDAEEVLGAIGPTLQLAQAGALELGRAADLASNVLTGFNIPAANAGRVIDVMALAANSANTNVEQLGEAMSYVAPISATLNVSLEETTAGIQTLSDAGIQASRAGTNLTMVMRRLEAPAGAQAKVLRELGLELEDVRISEVGLTQALQNLKGAGATQAQVFQLFGRSAAAASVLLEGVNGKLQDFTKANQNAKGTAEEIAEVMDDNLNGALLAVRSAWEELQLSFGDLGPEAGLTKSLQGLATLLRNTAANLGIVTKNAAALAVALAAIKWSAFLQGLTSAGTLVAVFNKGLVATKVALAGLAINPVTVGLVALAAAVVAVNTAFDQFAKLQQEIEDIEERTYKMRLKRLQAQVREIQERKAADKALEGYIKKLELENRFLGMTEEAKAKEISLTEAQAVAKRALTPVEQERISNLLREKQAIEDANDQREAELGYLRTLQAPAEKYKAELALLNSETVRAAITTDQYSQALADLRDKYGQGAEDTASTAVSDRIKQLERERELLGLSNRERERQLEIFRLQDALAADGESLGSADEDAIRRLLAENQAIAERQQVIQGALGPTREYQNEVRILNELIAEGGPNAALYRQRLQELKDQVKDNAEDEKIGLLGDSLRGTFDDATDALLDFTQTGKFEIRQFVSDVLSQIARLAAQQTFQSLGTAFGIPGIGARAAGGPVTGGQPYLVGERGPELMVPGRSGTIVPNNQLTAAVPSTAAPQMNVRVVNVLDPSLVRDALQSDEGEEVVVNVIQRNAQAIQQAIA